MKPLNLRDLRRNKHIYLDGVLVMYLTCDTHTATFRRCSDNRRIEFELTRDNDVMGWNGSTFQGMNDRYHALRRKPHAPTQEEAQRFLWQ